MKRFNFLAVLIFTFILSSCGGSHPDKSKTIEAKANDKNISKIEVIDFHATHRCKTCKAIEANTKYTLNTYFPNELKEGKITFDIINVDEEKNYDMAERFEAVGTALFLNVVANGQEKHIDLTDFAFLKGNEKDEFSKELKSKIETEIKNL